MSFLSLYFLYYFLSTRPAGNVECVGIDSISWLPAFPTKTWNETEVLQAQPTSDPFLARGENVGIALSAPSHTSLWLEWKELVMIQFTFPILNSKIQKALQPKVFPINLAQKFVWWQNLTFLTCSWGQSFFVSLSVMIHTFLWWKYDNICLWGADPDPTGNIIQRMRYIPFYLSKIYKILNF